LSQSELTVFGYGAGGSSSSQRDRFARFAEVLGKRARLDVQIFESSTYEELATAVISGYVDVAWLPPIPLIALAKHEAVTPLASLHRGGRSTFQSVIIVRSDSRFRDPRDLAGARAAWVDRYSASGFVVPRVALSHLGIDARTAFPQQRFWRSHDTVARVIVAGRADFGATYAGVDEAGEIVRGAWLDVKGASDAVRVLATLGEIPGDVVAAHARMPVSKKQRLTEALVGISRDGKTRLLANDAFGVEEFRPFEDSGYVELRTLTEAASDVGLLDLDESADETGNFTVK
jgi:phosphate/phosphite/phosphonate ABC transporter binding protein